MTTIKHVATATMVMCDAIEKADTWSLEVLARRYAGQVVTSRHDDRQAELDRIALRTIETYRRIVQEAAA